MSVTDAQPPAKLSAEKLVIGVIALLAIAAILYVLSQRQQELRRSQIGLDGLRTWFVAEGQSV